MEISFTKVNMLAIKLGGILSFIITGFLAWVLYISLVPVPPVFLVAAKMQVSVNNGVKAITETKTYKVLHRANLVSSRLLVQEGSGNQLPLEGGVIPVEKGEVEIIKQFLLPSTASGKWCEQMTLSWKPTLSLIEHSMSIPDACFELPED